MECKTTGRSRRLADDGRHFTDPAVRFAGIVVGLVNAAPVVIFSVAQHPHSAEPTSPPGPRYTPLTPTHRNDTCPGTCA